MTIIPIEIKADTRKAFLLNELLFICFFKLEQILNPRNPNPRKYWKEYLAIKLAPCSKPGKFIPSKIILRINVHVRLTP